MDTKLDIAIKTHKLGLLAAEYACTVWVLTIFVPGKNGSHPVVEYVLCEATTVKEVLTSGTYAHVKRWIKEHFQTRTVDGIITRNDPATVTLLEMKRRAQQTSAARAARTEKCLALRRKKKTAK